MASTGLRHSGYRRVRVPDRAASTGSIGSVHSDPPRPGRFRFGPCGRLRHQGLPRHALGRSAAELRSLTASDVSSAAYPGNASCCISRSSDGDCAVVRRSMFPYSQPRACKSEVMLRRGIGGAPLETPFQGLPRQPVAVPHRCLKQRLLRIDRSSATCRSEDLRRLTTGASRPPARRGRPLLR